MILRRLGVTSGCFGSVAALAIAMSDTDDLEPLPDQLDVEKLAAEALRAHYIKTLQQLRAILQRQAELQSLWTELDGDAHSFD